MICITCLQLVQSAGSVTAISFFSPAQEVMDYPTFLSNLTMFRFVLNGVPLRLTPSTQAAGSLYCLDHYPAV